MTPRPDVVAQAIHDACRPHMNLGGWCVNAAAVTRLVYLELGELSWPVQCTVVHMNEPYFDHVEGGGREEDLTAWHSAQPGDPFCVWAAAQTDAAASRSPWQPNEDLRPGVKGLPGHLLTWVGSGFVDPSAGQFSRPEHGILLEPCFWESDSPDKLAQFRRADGGVSIIVPTRLRGFTSAGAWVHRNDSITRELARLSLDQLGHPY